jgi:hypothetical protein
MGGHHDRARALDADGFRRACRIRARIDPCQNQRRAQEREGARRPYGQTPKLTPHQRAEALEALEEGDIFQADLARRFNVSISTVSRLANASR